MNIHWTKLTHRFPDEKQYLASFIAWQAAEVVAGAKPANLIDILDRQLTCGRNMSRLREKHIASVLRKGKISGLVLKQKDNRQLALSAISLRTPSIDFLTIPDK